MARLKPSRASAPSAANGPEIDVEKPTRTCSTGLAASGVTSVDRAQAVAMEAMLRLIITANLQEGGTAGARDAQVFGKHDGTSNRRWPGAGDAAVGMTQRGRIVAAIASLSADVRARL